MASTKLQRTAGTPTLNTKYTISVWCKRAKITGYDAFILDGYADANNRFKLAFQSADKIELWNSHSGTDTFAINTNRVFRDPSGWYNVVVSVDTTDATPGDRVKLYINGVRETSFSSSTDPSASEANNVINESGTTITIGDYQGGSNAYSGCMSHFHFIDGTAYPASTFGSTNSATGQWEINTSPSVTYGNNGFFILKDSGSVTDESGNANNFTVASGTLTNTEDCPSDVFATLNSVANTQSATELTNGNTTHTDTGGSWLGAYTTLGAFTGKFYAEGKIIDRMNYSFGVIQSGGDSVANINTSNNNLIGRWNDGWGFNGNNGTTNKKYHNNSTTDPYGEVFADNDIFMIAVDVTGGKIYFGRNGTWFDSGDPAAGTNPAFTGETFTNSVHFASGMENGALSWNFGNGYFGTTQIASEGTNASGIGKFEYDVPNGFTALSTKGLNE